MRFQPGDHLRTSRWGYHHHGVFMGYDGETGEPEVVHFSHPPGEFWGDRTVRRDPLKYFNNGRPAEVVDHPNALPRAEILKRALAWVSTEGGDFNIGANNCEHFANRCVDGKHYSRQVARVHIVFFITAFLMLLAGVGLIGRECKA